MRKLIKLIEAYSALKALHHTLNRKQWVDGLRCGWTMTPFGEPKIWLGATLQEAQKNVQSRIDEIESADRQ